jgi:hypothetical protein
MESDIFACPDPNQINTEYSRAISTVSQGLAPALKFRKVFQACVAITDLIAASWDPFECYPDRSIGFSGHVGVPGGLGLGALGFGGLGLCGLNFSVPFTDLFTYSS